MNKEKPIIFSTPMVQAILNTKPGVWPAEAIDPAKPFKSMTRRVMKPQPINNNGEKILSMRSLESRYAVGDILWVRETWNIHPLTKPDNLSELGYCSACTACKNINGEYIYKASFPPSYPCTQWKPSIFMPRKVARLFLKVKSVRIEKLQKITPEDCVNEGAVKKPHYMTYGGESYLAIHGRYKTEFAKLWDSINAKRGYSWESDPWVYVIEFIRLPDGGKK